MSRLITDEVGSVVVESSVLSVPVKITARDLTILTMLADGHQTSEIAIKLSFSERTIKLAISTMATHLGLRNRTHLVAWAFRQGLVK